MYIEDDTAIIEVPNEVSKVKLLLRPGTVLSPVNPLLLNATRTISSITVPLAVVTIRCPSTQMWRPGL